MKSNGRHKCTAHLNQVPTFGGMREVEWLCPGASAASPQERYGTPSKTRLLPDLVVFRSAQTSPSSLVPDVDHRYVLLWLLRRLVVDAACGRERSALCAQLHNCSGARRCHRHASHRESHNKTVARSAMHFTCSRKLSARRAALCVARIAPGLSSRVCCAHARAA